MEKIKNGTGLGGPLTGIPKLIGYLEVIYEQNDGNFFIGKNVCIYNLYNQDQIITLDWLMYGLNVKYFR